MAKASGYTLTAKDAPTVLGMEARGDREHDIASRFGVNQGRVAEVKAGKFGTPSGYPGSSIAAEGSSGYQGTKTANCRRASLSGTCKWK